MEFGQKSKMLMKPLCNTSICIQCSSEIGFGRVTLGTVSNQKLILYLKRKPTDKYLQLYLAENILYIYISAHNSSPIYIQYKKKYIKKNIKKNIQYQYNYSHLHINSHTNIFPIAKIINYVHNTYLSTFLLKKKNFSFGCVGNDGYKNIKKNSGE